MPWWYTQLELRAIRQHGDLFMVVYCVFFPMFGAALLTRGYTSHRVLWVFCFALFLSACLVNRSVLQGLLLDDKDVEDYAHHAKIGAITVKVTGIVMGLGFCLHFVDMFVSKLAKSLPKIYSLPLNVFKMIYVVGTIVVLILGPCAIWTAAFLYTPNRAYMCTSPIIWLIPSLIAILIGLGVFVKEYKEANPRIMQFLNHTPPPIVPTATTPPRPNSRATTPPPVKSRATTPPPKNLSTTAPLRKKSALPRLMVRKQTTKEPRGINFV